MNIGIFGRRMAALLACALMAGASPALAAGVTASDHPLATALTGAEAIWADQGSITVKIEPSQIATYVRGLIVSTDVTDSTTTGRCVLTAATASAARTCESLGTLATQAASSVAITGGAVDGATVGLTTPAAVYGAGITTVTGDLRSSATGFLQLGNGGTVTIAAGAVTAPASFFTVDTEASAATDDLDTINGVAIGRLYVVRTANSSHDVTIKDGTGNLRLPADCVLDNLEDSWIGVGVTSAIIAQVACNNNS